MSHISSKFLKMTTTHYVIVRRDLPLGVLAAMVTHAAGESAAIYKLVAGKEFWGCTAVVLEARNEAHLRKISLTLDDSDLLYVGVFESDGPYAGQMMALGLVPVEREKAAGLLGELQTLKSLTTPEIGLDKPAEV